MTFKISIFNLIIINYDQNIFSFLFSCLAILSQTEGAFSSKNFDYLTIFIGQRYSAGKSYVGENVPPLTKISSFIPNDIFPDKIYWKSCETLKNQIKIDLNKDFLFLGRSLHLPYYYG